MIEARENIDLVTIRRQSDLETSRTEAEQVAQANAVEAVEPSTVTTETAASSGVVGPAGSVRQTDGFSEMAICLVLAVILALAAAIVWWKGRRWKK